MDEFDKFEEELNINEQPTKPKSNNICPHKNKIPTDEDKITCEDCGTILSDNNVSYSKDWKFQNSGTNSTKKNQTRSLHKGGEVKTIDNDVVKLDISSDLKSRANDLFAITTKGNIFRGVKRKALIYICIVEAAKEISKEVDMYYLLDFFSLQQSRHAISSAFKEFTIATNHLNFNQKPKYITAVDLIPSILKSVSADDRQIADVLKIHNLIDGASNQLRTSRPQSIAAGVVYYYCEKTGKRIDISVISNISKVSPLTIKRNASEIEKCISSGLKGLKGLKGVNE
jgi:transcription initiation factor TFIIIB Brf1 subunit/transcription initiation factor TFIIB